MREKAIIVSVYTGGNQDEFEYSIAELVRLIDTAGGEVVEHFTQNLKSPDPTSYIGSGKAAEISAYLQEHEDIQTVIFDNELSPRQSNDLSTLFERKVIDRTEVILDIFASRAQTREAKLEVELAQLEYLYPRLTHKWGHLSRQGGGIGTNGPGETQLEMDRRHIKDKVSILKGRIKDVGRHREVVRQSRDKRGQKVVAIVGYTNSGKSTLLKALSKKEVYAKDQLFATLDPITRKVYLPTINKEILFSDTVGFIKNLPHHLVNSFKATLEEAVYADVLIHVVDAAATDIERQIDTVLEVLSDLGAHENKKIITVFNKVDLNIHEPLDQLIELYAPSLQTSALKKEGLQELLALVGESLYPPLAVAESLN